MKKHTTWASLFLALVIAIVPTLPPATAAEKLTFKDVPSSHWAASSINTAVQAGILNGYTDGTFKPENSITRAELIKVVAVTTGLFIPDRKSGQAWYGPYHSAVKGAGISMDGDFGSSDLNKPATRGEMAKLFVRAAKTEYRNQKLSANELMFRAVNAGLLSRTGKKAESIEPNGQTTRAQAAALIVRLMKLRNGESLTVDQGASSAAEIAWHRHNLITMWGQTDLKTLPYKIPINSRYEESIEQLIVIDPLDENGLYNEYLEGAEHGTNYKTGSYVFAFKLKGRSLVAKPGTGESIGQVYLYVEDRGSALFMNRKFGYRDGKVIDRPGIFFNMQMLELTKAGEAGYNFYFLSVHRDYVQSQIQNYGVFPIRLIRYSDQKAFYLTSVGIRGQKVD